MEEISYNKERAMVDLTLKELSVISAALMLVIHRLGNEDVVKKLELPYREKIEPLLDDEMDDEYKRIYDEITTLVETMKKYKISE